MQQPDQPLVLDEHGTVRFRENAIVRYLLDAGGIDMNRLALLPFSQEDREQFAQLIGYSVCGFGELDYVSDEAWARAKRAERAEEVSESIKISDELVGFVEEVQEVRRRLLGSTLPDVPGRTSDVKEVALLRLQQAADVMAEEAVALERVGE